jgi:hypothetical protein
MDPYKTFALVLLVNIALMLPALYAWRKGEHFDWSAGMNVGVFNLFLLFGLAPLVSGLWPIASRMRMSCLSIADSRRQNGQPWSP